MILHRTMKKERRKGRKGSLTLSDVILNKESEEYWKKKSLEKLRERSLAYLKRDELSRFLEEEERIRQRNLARMHNPLYSECSRFLSLWDCKTGKAGTPKPEGFKFLKGDYFVVGDAYPIDDPNIMEYSKDLAYQQGDLFWYNGVLYEVGIHNKMKEAKNYRPDGTEEKRPVHKGDVYVFDGEDLVLVDSEYEGSQTYRDGEDVLVNGEKVTMRGE